MAADLVGSATAAAAAAAAATAAAAAGARSGWLLWPGWRLRLCPCDCQALRMMGCTFHTVNVLSAAGVIQDEMVHNSDETCGNKCDLEAAAQRNAESPDSGWSAALS